MEQDVSSWKMALQYKAWCLTYGDIIWWVYKWWLSRCATSSWLDVVLWRLNASGAFAMVVVTAYPEMAHAALLTGVRQGSSIMLIWWQIVAESTADGNAQAQCVEGTDEKIDIIDCDRVRGLRRL